jgi:glycosyltransferase involved in cell wall biosynthesis
MKARIAIFHWGRISIYCDYLVEELNKNGIGIDLFIYAPMHLNKTNDKAQIKKVYEDTKIFEIKSNWLEVLVIKFIQIIFKNQSPSLLINPLVLSKTRKVFKTENYKYIIPISHYSLYWLYRTDHTSLDKAAYYSLEIYKVTDPYIKKDSWAYKIINIEEKLLRYVYALIIQDNLRAEAFLPKHLLQKLNVIYFPLSIPGECFEAKNNYLHEKLAIAPDKKILLYFGAAFEERKIDEMISCFRDSCPAGWVLVIHTPDQYYLDPAFTNAKLSNEIVDYADLHKIISSATIGIALYDNSWPNTRLTAFSSEKIARYLQAGVPFIAFKNESYERLVNEFTCCALIEDIGEIERAINYIMNDYENFRNECYRAYEKYYNIKTTIRPVVHFLVKE